MQALLEAAEKGGTMELVEAMFSRREGYSQARRHPRVPADFPIFVRDRELRLTDRARDVSEVGVGVETDHPLAPMTLVSLRLELPHASTPVNVLGRVMWSSGTAMGIRFEQNDPVLLDVVDRLRRELQAI